MPKSLKVPPLKSPRSVKLSITLFSAPIDSAHSSTCSGSVRQRSRTVQSTPQARVADALTEGPLRLDDLADRVGANPDALGRLMRALISCGVFRQRRDGRYDLNALANALRSDVRYSMYGWARVVGSPQHREHWSLLVESIKSGKAILPQVRGKEAFEYLRDEPELAKVLNDAMTTLSDVAAVAIVAGYDFGRYRTIVDVGGGQGGLLSEILCGNTERARRALRPA